MGQTAIELKDITRDYSIGLRGYRLRALDKVNLSMPAGEIFGLLGPNGSGKSTTIKVILGLIRPSEGSCKVFGRSAGSQESRCRIGYLPENPVFYRFLTGRELVRFFASISGMHRGLRAEAVEQALETVRMLSCADRRVRTYSKGMLQRIGLAQALVHDPDILVLDEPMSGLDPIGTREVMDILQRLRSRGKTILLASHLLARVEEVCDRIAILHKGRLVRSGSVEDIVHSTDSTLLNVRGFGPEKESLLRRLLEEADIQIEEVRQGRRRLDEVFLDALEEEPEGPQS